MQTAFGASMRVKQCLAQQISIIDGGIFHVEM